MRSSFNGVYDTALQNNLQLRAADLQIERNRILARTWLDIPKTGVFAENEDLTPRDGKGILKIGLSQSFEWPTVYKAKRNLLQQHVKSIELSKQLRALEIKRDVQSAFYTIGYLEGRRYLFQRLDSVYKAMAEAARLKVRTGESAGLDSISAIARSREISVQLSMLEKDIRAQQQVLGRLTNTNILFLPESPQLEKVQVELSLDTLRNHPGLQLQTQNVAISEAEVAIQKHANKPTFDGRFFSQRLYSLSNPYSGFSVSVGIPIFARSTYRQRVRAAELERDYQRALIGNETLNMTSEYNQLVQQLRKDEELLAFYESTGLAQADAIMKAANISYRAGEISFADLSQFLTQAIDIQRNYLEVLNQYNQSAIQLNYFLNR